MQQYLRLPVSTVLIALAVACSSRDTAAPVARVSMTPSRTRAAIGSPLEFAYRFDVAPDAAIGGDYKVFVHVLDADERMVWNDDHDPPIPTSSWTPGQVIEYTRTLFVPAFSIVGDVTVAVGLYRDDGRLPLEGPDEADRDDTDRAYRVAGLHLLPETENVFVIYKSGWHPDEFSPEAPEAQSWKWTQGTAVLSFLNPRRDITFYLEYDTRPDVFADTPQQVAIKAGDRTIETFAADHVGPRLLRIPIPADALGTAEMAELRIEVDRTFVPANLPAGGKDTRELGIRVYHAFVEGR
jgi:hypothetical protein